MNHIKLSVFLTKKIIGSIITVFLVMSILFVLLHSVSGGDMVVRMHPFASAEQKAQLRQLWGLDKPLYEQYIIFMKKVFTLDYRLTPAQETTSMDMLLFFLPYTVLLFGTAAVCSYFIGAFLGIRLLSSNSDTLKTVVTAASMVLYAVPAFVMAISLKSLLVFKHQVFPPVHMFNEGAATITEHAENVYTLLPAMVLPLSILVLVGLARPLLLLKDHMSLLVTEPYVSTARAKGLTKNQILTNHVGRCALLPLMSDASINLALIFSGGILIEYIFSWPGIGLQLFAALKNLYYPTIAAAIFLLTVLLLFSMILVDIINVYLDPRINVVISGGD
ncbi:MAG: ABC transporter permease [Candidatus Methanofastidiosia archaeon]|jgi:peptide/nickel transport system permease protein